MSFAADTHLGPYKIISLVGPVGMGQVWRACDLRMKGEVGWAGHIIAGAGTQDIRS